MKPIAILLLGYVLVGEIFLKFLPIPFLDIVIGLLITPLAHLISWKELFQINFIFSVLQSANTAPMLFGAISLIPSNFSYELVLMAIVFAIVFQIVSNTITLTILQKLLYFLVPKRLRLENIKL